MKKFPWKYCPPIPDIHWQCKQWLSLWQWVLRWWRWPNILEMLSKAPSKWPLTRTLSEIQRKARSRKESSLLSHLLQGSSENWQNAIILPEVLFMVFSTWWILSFIKTYSKSNYLILLCILMKLWYS